MASAPDLANTIALISNFWPDLKFEKDDVATGNPDFIVEFYKTFFSELNDKISYLLNEEITIDEFDDIQGFDIEVTLYCKLVTLMRKMECALHLIDFYVRNPKKMYQILKVSIHFVIYVNNYLDFFTARVNENLNKLIEYENLGKKKQELLQENADNGINLTRGADTFENLKAKLEHVKRNHKKMLEDKVIDDRMYAEKTAELNQWQSETDNMEYELKLLEDKDNFLKECVITEAEFETLRNIEKYLKIEEQQLSIEHHAPNDTLHMFKENIEDLKKCEKQLELLHLDNLDVDTLHERREQVKLQQSALNKLNDDLSLLNNTVLETKKKVEDLIRTLDKTKVLFEQLKQKFALDLETQKQHFAKMNQKYRVEFEESQRVITQTIKSNKKIEDMEKGKRKLNVVDATEYEKILSAEKNVKNKFYQMLLNLNGYN